MTTSRQRLRRAARRASAAVAFRVPPLQAAWKRHAGRIDAAAIAEALRDPAVAQLMLSGDSLPSGWGMGMSERIVEFPWVASHLAKIPAGFTLDAGSTLNHGDVLDRVMPLVSKLHIVTLAPESQSFTSRGVSYLYADLRDLPLRDDLYDTIVCLSTLEHVGMDVSGFNAHVAVEPDPQLASILAAQEMRRVLKPGGRILVSVPYGRPENLKWVRQFDERALREVIAAFGSADVQTAVYKYSGAGWQVSSLKDAADCPSQAFWASAVACVEIQAR